MTDAVEHRVQSIGREILDRAAEHRGRLSLWAGADQALMARLMEDPELRLQVMHFVDVLPVLTDDAALVRHAQEYFDEHLLAEVMPSPLSKLGAMADWGLRHSGGSVTSHVVAAAVRAVVERLALRFIAGHDIDTALHSLERLRKRGMSFSLDVLGEATVTDAEAENYFQRYRDLIDQLPQRYTAARVNISVKISSLYSQMNPVDFRGSVEGVKARLRPLLLLARQRDAHVTLDMEQYDYKAITLEVFRELLTEPDLRDWRHVGIAMQAYLRDTPDDIAALLEWAQKRGTSVRVRLVRGAYWDYETTIADQQGWDCPVWRQKHETDACYEACCATLMENAQHLRPAIATHNVRSQALACALAERHAVASNGWEMQMLYGMAEPVKAALVEMGLPLRVYVPFGELIPGMAYFVRRLLENTASQSFVRLAGAEDAPPEVLLAKPKSIGKAPVTTAAGFVNEPLRRFTDAKERDALGDAIAALPLGETYPLLIDGNPRETDETLASINPSNPSQVVGICGSASAQDVDDALHAATRAIADWAARPFAERANVLRDAAGIMRSRRDELAAWEVIEAGKPWREADADVVEAIDFLMYYAHQADSLDKGVDLSVPGQTNRYLYEPRGVAAVIAPWNFPLAIVTGMTSAALVAGNTVVVKPAPQTPVMAALMTSILQEAGVPGGALHYLPGGDAPGKALVSDPRVHVIAFTGSLAAGARINAEGARIADGQHHVKKVIAEMGGKNAIVIDASADLDEAVVATVYSAFGYAGQKCSAASRAIVVGDAVETFIDRLIAATASITVGPAADPHSYLGPVIDAEARDRINAAIDDAQQDATLAHRTDVADLGDGYFVGPAVFTDVDPASDLAQHEIFGPVLAVMRAADLDAAFTMANNTRFGLTAGIFSRTPSHLDLARTRLRAGNVYLNQKITGSVVNRQPFGGLKLSGIGSKAGGPDYLMQFVQPRVVTENTLRRGYAPRDDQG